MTGLMAGATVCGAMLGAGLWLFLVRLPFMRPTTFVERIEPQLRTHSLESRLLRTAPRNVTPFGRSGTVPGPWAGSTLARRR